MYKIVKREVLVPNTIYIKAEALAIAQKARPGQFIILRVDDVGERFPMSLAGWDKDEGTIEITFGIMGKSTMKLAALGEGDCISDVAGPLGNPTEIDSYGNVLCACGHFGIGPMATVIKALKEKGNRIITVLEAKDETSLFWEDRLKEISDELHVVIGDGSRGGKVQIDEFVKEYLENGNKVDRALAIGRVFMMMELSKATIPFGVKTIVSLTPIMVDGTGMCGCCRVSIGEETKFACVDGPEFDGHLVDWELLIKRKRAYLQEEALAYNLGNVETLRKLSDLAQLPGCSK
ncbi:sulfide/dihydroorotate dehydrogenase-like FAD/NAD-binding protein [Chloroflexota bacterium]